jgi:hypothetical protein
MLLAPLFATLGALLGVMDGDVGQCHLTTAQGCVPTPGGRVKFSHLFAIGILDVDAERLLRGVPENVIRCLEGQRLLCVTQVASGCLRP